MADAIPTRHAGPSGRAFAALLAGVLLIPQLAMFGTSCLGLTYPYPLDLLALPGYYLPATPEWAGVRPNNPHLSDLVLEVASNRDFFRKEFRAGRVPLWNPEMFAGVPAATTPKYSPFELALVCFESPVAVAWQQVAQGVLAGLGCYFVLRRVVGVSRWAALLAAACYPWTGYFVLWQGYTLTQPVVWLPWIVWATWSSVLHPGKAGSWALAVLTAVVVFCRPDTAGQVLLVSGLAAVYIWATEYHACWRTTRSLSALGVTGLAWGLGLVACSVYVLPFLDYSAGGSRMRDRLKGVEERPPVGLQSAPLVLLPDAFGSYRRSELQLMSGNQFESAASGYAGLVLTLVLVPLALCAQRQMRWTLALSAVAVWGMAWQLNIPGLVQILRLPPLNALSHNRFVFATAWALIGLGAVGWDAVRDPSFASKRWFALPLAVTLLFGAWCGYRWIELPNELRTLIDRRRLIPPAHVDVALALINCGRTHLRGLVLSLMAAGAWWCMRWPWRGRMILSLGLAAVALGELLWFASGEVRSADPRLYYPQLAVFRQLADLPAGRVMGVMCLPSNLNHWTGRSDPRGYDAVDPTLYLDVFQRAVHPRQDSPAYARTQWGIPVSRVADDDSLRISPIFDMLGVRYLIVRNPPPPKAKTILHEDDYWVLENTHALPRAFVPDRIVQLESDEEVLEQMSSDNFDAAMVSYTTQPIAAERPAGPGAEASPPPAKTDSGPLVASAAEVRIVNEHPQMVHMKANLASAGTLVLADLWDAGWSAYSAGERLPVLRINHCLRGVALAAGQHDVVFRYEPRSFRMGLWLSGLGGAAMLTWGLGLLYSACGPGRRTGRALSTRDVSAADRVP